MLIRPICAADLSTVHGMIGELSAFHDAVAEVTLDTMTRDMLGQAPWIRVLVAERKGDLLAYAALLPLANVANGRRGLDINHMFVRAPHRGGGIGRALIDASLEVAHDLACSFAFISTAPENTDAQAAYQACGFEAWPHGGPRFRRLIEPRQAVG